jgi:hypothetical protein
MGEKVSLELIENGLNELGDMSHLHPEAAGILLKLRNKSKEIYNAIKDYDVSKMEQEVATNREELLKEGIARWKGLMTLMDNFDKVTEVAGITDEEEKDKLWLSMLDTMRELAGNELPYLYTEVKAVREYGYEAHNVTLKDVSLLLVPLAIYILLERR